MKTLLLFVGLVIAGNAMASLVEADPAERLPKDVLGAESVTIEFYSREGKNEVTFSDPAWLQRLAFVLATAIYRPQSHCLCISYPMIHLRGKDGKVGTLSVHHGAKLRAYFGAVSGDFTVGEATGRAIASLAMEKAPGNRKE